MTNSKVPEDLQGHVLITGADGELLSPSADEVWAMLERATKHGRVVLHFHGGLVPEKSGLTVARNLLPVYQAAGADPIFVVWRSGATEILLGNMKEVVQEELFGRLVRRATQWVVGKARGAADGGRTISSLPGREEMEDEFGRLDELEPFAGTKPESGGEISDLTLEEQAKFLLDAQADHDLRRDVLGALVAAGHEMHEGSRAAEPQVEAKPSRLDPAVLAEMSAEEGERSLGSILAVAKKLLAVVRNVLRRYADQVDHGIYPTVVEEVARELYFADIGGALWQAMKKETLDTFGEAGEVGERGGRLIVDGLFAAAKEFPEVTLVGHSTGAVYIDNLLNEVHARKAAGQAWPDKARFAVALLAPACTSADFAAMLAESEPLIGSIRVFAMADEAEQKDHVLGAAYPRSLLYLVSGLAERDEGVSAQVPLVGLARYFDQDEAKLGRLLASNRGQRANLERTRRYLLRSGCLVCSPTGEKALEGWRASAIRHGDFDEDLLVRESLQAMIRGGSR